MLWLGIILISLSWRVAFHLVTAPDMALTLFVLIAGVLCMVASGAAGPSRPVGRALPALLAAAGTVFLLSGISTGLLLRLAPWFHDIAIPGRLAPVLDRISARFGQAGGLVTFWNGRGLAVVRVTFEGLGLYEVWFVAVGMALAVLVFGGGRRVSVFVRAMPLILVYALVRFIVLVALAVEVDRPAVLWHPGVTVISYIPLAPLIGGFPGLAPAGFAASFRRLALAAAIAIALAGATTFPGERLRNAPVGLDGVRLLVDETHSDWEWAREPFDTTGFGIRAEYNYYCFVEYLGEFCDVAVRSDGVTAAALDDFDVLIVKTPTESYSAGEIDAIEEFVRGGGGLLLIGDHTNLFGMTTYLNAIGERFGMRFRCDDTFDLATGGFTSLVPMGFWTHPAMRGIWRFRFLTSCTVEGGPGIEPVMLGMGLGSEDGDYGHPNFFGNISYDLADRFGVFLQAAGRRFGRGRVLLFTDSTCFSNFCMFSPGTPEVALGLLRYVACRSAGADPAAGDLASGSVLVDTTHSRASFFDYIGASRRPEWEGFEEFYISVARAGMRPVAGEIPDLACRGAAALAIVNPRRSFAPGEVERIFEFVKGGGRLLVLDGVANSESVANEVLGVFGMGIAARPVAAGGGIVPGLEVLGGEPLALTPAGDRFAPDCTSDSTGRICVARQVCGAGAVIVAVDSYTYSAAGLGRPLQNVHAYAATRPRYRRLFALLDEIR